MNRPIEFRVWREEYKCLEYFDLFSAEMYAADGTIMQYTGLKDKNGVKIFEGDIVRTSLYGQRDCEVVFMKCGFYILLDTGIGTNLYEPSGVTMEVIGNIYESPELLEHKCST